MSGEGAIVEEEYLVYAELCDNTDPNIFSHADTSFKSFALDSDQPILTVGGQAFVGKYKDTVGTAVFLEEIQPGIEEQIGFGNEPIDPLFVDAPEKKLQYVCHTRKSLEMSRVLLLEKKKQAQNSEKVDDDRECLPPGELNVSAEGLKDLKIGTVDETTAELMKNLCVDSDKMVVHDESLLPSMEGGKMIKNIEKMNIEGSHSDG